jgi:hypothetical protein
MAEGRDHEIMRALDPHLKTGLWKIEIKFCVVTGLQLECSRHARPGSHFVTILFMWALLHNKL